MFSLHIHILVLSGIPSSVFASLSSVMNLFEDILPHIRLHGNGNGSHFWIFL